MKAQTLKLNRDFKRLYSKGKSFVSPALVTYVQKKNNNKTRLEVLEERRKRWEEIRENHE